ncbi:alanine racemase [Candidatus Omnitrophota bacterium]
MKFYRPTYAEIDLNAMRHNLRKIKGIVGKDMEILGIVKADAYGHGMLEVSRTLLKQGVKYLGVASLDEAASLRAAGIKAKIIVLGSILPQETEGVLKYNAIQAVSDLRIAKALSKLARKKKKNIRIHIKIDTGMGRLGFWHEEAIGFVKTIASLKNLIIDGIFTHFPSAESDAPFTQKQIKDFNFLMKELWRCGIDIPIKHTSNSMALVDFKESHMNMVRPGLIMYGLHPREDLLKRLDLRPVLKLKTKIVHLKSLARGRSVSYGRTYVAGEDTKIATIPVGYGDGYSRHLSNRADVLIKGRRAPVVGRVCMDMTMVYVGHIKDVKVGDEAVLIGSQGKDIIRAEELANLIYTIPYEIVCNIGRRIPRIYIR